jgi:hypothetical protein
MRNVLGRETVLNDIFLDGMRETVDPSADAVASSLCARGAHRLVGELIKHRQMWDADGAPSRFPGAEKEMTTSSAVEQEIRRL